MATHKSSQEWSEILAAYENRKVTQGQFCRDIGSLRQMKQHLLERMNARRIKTTRKRFIQ